ncbi:putative aryl-alcohol dehydrogenase [Moniliophthora roreri]|nr:putative aryl-alcohol dehydrogenase [Moniliophthora roreri]
MAGKGSVQDGSGLMRKLRFGRHLKRFRLKWVQRVSLLWPSHGKKPDVFPIIGGRKVEQL